ncbi:MAG TPA: GNAT family N-acetyltransferase [Thermoanaerobaculia bacterium]|nr:GNAT family N-acetyltransferase [Thermoanaerobaculia bacterium]
MDLKVQQDEKDRKFYADVDGQEAVVEYAKTGNVYDLAHTHVPEELRGKGVGEKLVRGALDEIQRQGAQFLPSCPFIQAFLKKHPEYERGMARG